MTIVLASIADKGSAIIMASDRMLARGQLSYQFEHDSPKIRVIGNYLIGYAGTTSYGDDIISHPYKNTKGGVREFIDEFSEFYVKYGNKIVSRVLLESVGLTLEAFNKNPTMYPAPLQQKVYDGMGKPKLNVSFIVCGYDGEQPKMYVVHEFGIFTSAHSIGYTAVGIGEPHAANFYMVNGYKRDTPLKEAIYFAYRAKKSAEIAGGVGQCTDIYILHKGKSAVNYQDGSDFIKELNRIYEHHNGKTLELYKEEILPEIEKLSLEAK